MPSQRKRIGFLPSLEVQRIIDQISKNNKLSQSKVTGILVKEALSSRGVLNGSVDSKPTKLPYIKTNSLFENVNYNNEEIKENDNFILDESHLKDEIQMINDFIEFKFFKNIMNKNKKYK